MVEPTSQVHQLSGFGEEDFKWGLTIYGHGGHLGHVIMTIGINFRSHTSSSLHMKFEFNWPTRGCEFDSGPVPYFGGDCS